MDNPTCDYCDGTHDLRTLKAYWVAGGRSCFHFQWRKCTDERTLCDDCEARDFGDYCYNCGTRMESSFIERAYVWHNIHDFEVICPDCFDGDNYLNAAQTQAERREAGVQR